LAANFESANEYYEDALKLYCKKDFASAIIQLKNALQLDYRHLPAKILIGESYLGVGESEVALASDRHWILR
jgi:lipopolysaccharide biosynthesis regulator YciM